MTLAEGEKKYQDLIGVFESTLEAYGNNLKVALRPGLNIFANKGGFDFIYTSIDLTPQALLQLSKIEPGEDSPVKILVPAYPGGIFDLSCYVCPAARRQGIAKDLVGQAETLVGAILKRDRKTDKALLAMILGVPPKQAELVAGLTRMAIELGYDQLQERLFLKEVDPNRS